MVMFYRRRRGSGLAADCMFLRLLLQGLVWNVVG